MDIATKIAISASKPDRNGDPVVDASTINNLLTILQNRKNVDEVIAYIIRQMGREEIDPDTGKLLLKALQGKDLEKALSILGYVKWIYEGISGLNVDWNSISKAQTFKDIVTKLVGSIK